ncbi:MAG: SCP2 sterol-binding domain-containing protein [Trebonia sp.]
MRYSTHMRSAEECREALEKLAGRLAEVPPAERETYFGDRTISVTIPDLGVTYATRLGSGDDPVHEAAPGDPPADIRLTADSDEVVSLAQTPLNIARAWMNGRVKIEASVKDLFRLRRLL